MYDPRALDENTPLQSMVYREDPDRTWDALMNLWKQHEESILRARDELDRYDTPLALTECHPTLRGRNRCEVLSTWAAGVANGRLANLHERHGDKLKIATLADFCGTRWQVNAVMIPVPGGRSFMMPVAKVMSLYRRHSGEQAVSISNCPPDLDVTASRTGDRFYLHAVNTLRSQSIAAELSVDGAQIMSGRAFTLAADPEFEVWEYRDDVLQPVEAPVPADGRWTFPAASVTAVELNTQQT
jgi:hypothetical protein